MLSNNAGEVVVRSWDQDKVRIQATHGARDTVTAETTDMTLRIRTRSTRGPSGLIDYLITVPKWMPVNLSGTYLDATIEGTTAEVTVETVHGNARVTGGTGAVSVRSVEGIITIDKASGRVQATTVNEGIRVTNVTGEITAETTNGDIVIENAQTSNLEASTVNGDVTFNGTVRDSGVYRLTTHGGDIRVGLGGAGNATVFVRTFQGDFTADFPMQLPEGQTPRSGSKRFNFTLGTGSARIELQSFNGDIVLARKAIVSKEEERARRRGMTPPPPPPPPQPPQPPRRRSRRSRPAWTIWRGTPGTRHSTRTSTLTFDNDFEKTFDKTFDREFRNELREEIREELREDLREQLRQELREDVREEASTRTSKSSSKKSLKGFEMFSKGGPAKPKG